jgi:hypothetical protein
VDHSAHQDAPKGKQESCLPSGIDLHALKT